MIPPSAGPEDNDAESLALSLEGVARWAGVWDRIDRIDVPALLVCGDKDSYYDGARRPRPPCRKASSSDCRA